jgi:nicotinate dehydrogenase subunit A
MRLNVNGESHDLEIDPDVPLLHVLRDALGLKSVKLGCGLEQCGACKVLVDGAPEFSCRRAAGEFENVSLVTVEGFANEALHPIQQVLLEHNAGQCGYCLSGILIAARALFDVNPRPSRREIQFALDDHLCRCGAQPRILNALGELSSRG